MPEKIKKEILRDIKNIGGHNQHPDRQKTLTAKSKLSALVKAYERFKTDQDQYPLTYEVIYGHAWGAHPPTQWELESGEFHIPLEALQR